MTTSEFSVRGKVFVGGTVASVGVAGLGIATGGLGWIAGYCVYVLGAAASGLVGYGVDETVAKVDAEYKKAQDAVKAEYDKLKRSAQTEIDRLKANTAQLVNKTWKVPSCALATTVLSGVCLATVYVKRQFCDSQDAGYECTVIADGLLYSSFAGAVACGAKLGYEAVTNTV
jgi:hypothetical protein